MGRRSSTAPAACAVLLGLAGCGGGGISTLAVAPASRPKPRLARSSFNDTSLSASGRQSCSLAVQQYEREDVEFNACSSRYHAFLRGSAAHVNDLPPQYRANVNVNVTEVPYNRLLGDAPALSDARIDDVSTTPAHPERRLHALNEHGAPSPAGPRTPSTRERKRMTSTRWQGAAASAAIAAGLALTSAPASAQSDGQAELAARVDQLAAELAAVKAELAKLLQQQAANAVTVKAPSGTAPVAAASAAMVAQGPGLSAEPATVLTSYGELNYNRPTHASKNAVADVRRFVLGYQHRFDDKTKVVTELEVEHAISSASDPGEVEVEQAYLERQLSPGIAVRAGLFLMPVGLLNENHEPTAFYGVERNFVETAIIPSTWREGGVQFVAGFDNGLSAQAGVTTGFDLGKWDATSTKGAASPLGSIHQEMALARARDLSVFGAFNWRGMPGLLLGGSIFTGGATHGQTVARSRVTLWDLHARYTPGKWDLSSVYSRGTISNTAVFNAPLVSSLTLIPKSFDGWYGQAAYHLWSSGDYALSPFARWERFNTARSYADLGAGLTPPGARTERVITVGANFNIGSSIVVKADYQQFRENKDNDRFDLGLGWSF